MFIPNMFMETLKNSLILTLVNVLSNVYFIFGINYLHSLIAMMHPFIQIQIIYIYMNIFIRIHLGLDLAEARSVYGQMGTFRLFHVVRYWSGYIVKTVEKQFFWQPFIFSSELNIFRSFSKIPLINDLNLLTLSLLGYLKTRIRWGGVNLTMFDV